jgi:hypothetical protein
VSKNTWFYNYAYRHMLRSPADLSSLKGHKRIQYAYYERVLKRIKKEFRRAKLDLDGYSAEHSMIIYRAIGIGGKCHE